MASYAALATNYLTAAFLACFLYLSRSRLIRSCCLAIVPCPLGPSTSLMRQACACTRAVVFFEYFLSRLGEGGGRERDAAMLDVCMHRLDGSFLPSFVCRHGRAIIYI